MDPCSLCLDFCHVPLRCRDGCVVKINRDTVSLCVCLLIKSRHSCVFWSGHERTVIAFLQLRLIIIIIIFCHKTITWQHSMHSRKNNCHRILLLQRCQLGIMDKQTCCGKPFSCTFIIKQDETCPGNEGQVFMCLGNKHVNSSKLKEKYPGVKTRFYKLPVRLI